MSVDILSKYSDITTYTKLSVIGYKIWDLTSGKGTPYHCDRNQEFFEALESLSIEDLNDLKETIKLVEL